MKPKKVLIAYSSSSTHVQTTFEYLTSLKGLAGCEVQFVHCTNDARMHFDINEFDVLVNNYCCRLCYDWYISPDYERAVLSFRGLKIAIVQDDYEHTAVLQRRIRHLGFHVLFTSIQPEFWPLVYPALAVPGTALRHLLTGYAPSPKPGRKIKPLSDRPFRIAYRGRKLNALYGRLGFEKYEIGRRMAEICEARGLTTLPATKKAASTARAGSISLAIAARCSAAKAAATFSISTARLTALARTSRRNTAGLRNTARLPN